MAKRFVGLFPPPGWLVCVWHFERVSLWPRLGGELRLVLELERAGGRATQMARFVNAKAVHWDAEPVATVWQIEDAYCRVVEIEDSEWMDWMRREYSRDPQVGRLRHFLMYVEDYGAVEVAAEEVIVEDVQEAPNA